jgi:hypothetical protein
MSSEAALPSASAFPLRLRNLLAAASAVAIGCGVYAFVPYNREQMDRLYGNEVFSFRGDQFLAAAATFYIALLCVYYLAEARPGASKSLRFFRLLGTFVRSPAATWRTGLAPEDRLALLTTLLKAFFGPLMVVMLMRFTVGALTNGSAILASAGGEASFMEIFNRHGFWFVIQIILFVDVAVFTVGYLVETRRLGNEIRSVDPTLLGWAAALMCYPPFNTLTGKILGSNVSDFPRFDDPTTHLVLNLALLTLMAVYASASVALGLKASNLTHRGIVSRGPYALVRHPAYACKNMAWWIGSIPLVSAAFSQSLFAGVSAVASVIAWTMLYVLRALTEEDHLRRVDGDYAAYAARVRFRFIPGVA